MYSPIKGATFAVPVLVLGFALLERFRKARDRKGLPYPPGPKRLPVVGNLFELISGNQSETFLSWTEKFGPVVYAEALGQGLLILGSIESITDLLETRSSIYSSRPKLAMLTDLMDCHNMTGFLPYGDTWRAHRRAFHPYTSQTAIGQWEGVQTREARTFLRRLLVDTDDLTALVRHLVAAVIVGIVYDICVLEKNDRYQTIAEDMAERVIEATLPGAFLVNDFPMLKHIPTWFPAAKFHRKGAEAREVMAEMLGRPFDIVKEKMARGEDPHCMLALMLAQIGETKGGAAAEDIVRGVCGGAYIAGAETTSSSLLSFFLAMMLNPEAQRRAQAELDAVVGSDRLPEFADRAHLPYITAVLLETLRWQPVTPLSIPHALIEDDEYNGYLIPAGTIVIGNARKYLYDPVAYPDPETFRPERFLHTNEKGQTELDPSVRDPRLAAFGFGRRICPGRFMAEQTLWAAISSVLATYTIAPILDAEGRIPKVDIITSGITSQPERFNSKIKPRSARAEQLVKEIIVD